MTHPQTCCSKVRKYITDKNLEIVEKKYRSDVLNYVALQDARKDYIRALDSYIDSIYNYNIALI